MTRKAKGGLELLKVSYFTVTLFFKGFAPVLE